ncbi:MAG: site-specific integrase [Candidatus Tectomicrobia bacterium]
MLKTYFKRERTRTTHAAGPAGPYLDDFSHWLEKSGFTTRTIRGCLFGATQFTAWAEGTGSVVQSFDSSTLDEFRCYLAKHSQLRYASGRPTPRCMGAHHFLTFLSSQGIVPESAVAAPNPAPPTLLSEFQHWMHVHRGVTEQTLRNYRPIILDLLTSLGDRPGNFEAKSLRAFVLDRAQRHGKGKAKSIVTAIRMFVRFLIASGRCTPGLDEAIPTIAVWRLATLPQYLPAEDVERVISMCDPSTPLGARDLAIILLMARLGLRGSDVARLRFPDINWQDATLVVSGKSRRETRLPLPKEVGDALLHYLEYARPSINIDSVFVTVIAPWGPISRQVIRKTAARAVQRAGIRTPTIGSRVFRHSAATTLLRQGASLQTIGDVLRHTSIETTAQYAKVDIDLLQQVARPWPGVVLC